MIKDDDKFAHFDNHKNLHCAQPIAYNSSIDAGMPASSLSYNNINSDSRMIPDIMRVFCLDLNSFNMLPDKLRAIMLTGVWQRM